MIETPKVSMLRNLVSGLNWFIRATEVEIELREAAANRILAAITKGAQ